MGQTTNGIVKQDSKKSRNLYEIFQKTEDSKNMSELKNRKNEQKKLENMDKEDDRKPLSTFEFSLKNLPIFSQESLPSSYQMMMSSTNQSLMMTSMGLPKR